MRSLSRRYTKFQIKNKINKLLQVQYIYVQQDLNRKCQQPKYFFINCIRFQFFFYQRYSNLYEIVLRCNGYATNYKLYLLPVLWLPSAWIALSLPQTDHWSIGHGSLSAAAVWHRVTLSQRHSSPIVSKYKHFNTVPYAYISDND